MSSAAAPIFANPHDDWACTFLHFELDNILHCPSDTPLDLNLVFFHMLPQLAGGDMDGIRT